MSLLGSSMSVVGLLSVILAFALSQAMEEIEAELVETETEVNQWQNKYIAGDVIGDMNDWA